MRTQTRKSRRQIEQAAEERFDDRARQSIRNCIRYARMCEAGTPARLFWLRVALQHNAGRYHNWITVSNLYPLTRGANVA